MGGYIPVREITIPIKTEYLEELLRFVDDALIAQSCSAIMRLRASMIVEEIFEAVQDAVGDREVEFTCRLGPDRGAFLFDVGQWHKLLQLQNLDMLLRRPAARGVEVKAKEPCLHMGLHR